MGGSDLFSHNFFKNQRKSKKKKKKISMDIYKKNLKLIIQRLIVSTLNKKKQKMIIIKKLNKIKEERKLDIDRKFKKNHLQAQKTHPYFVNIRKANEKKKNKKKKVIST